MCIESVNTAKAILNAFHSDADDDVVAGVRLMCACVCVRDEYAFN